MSQPIKIPAVPVTGHAGLNSFLTSVKQIIEANFPTTPAPQPVTGLKATPVSGGVVISFTRSNAQNFRLYYGSSPDRLSAAMIDLGSNSRYTDNVGQGGITRYYWVQALNNNATSPSEFVGPVKATSLALGSSATVPDLPVPEQSYQTVFDTTINSRRPVIYESDGVSAPKQGAD